MISAEILQELDTFGVKISVLNGNLKLKGATQSIPPELIMKIREQKTEIIDHLNRQALCFPLTALQQAYFRGRSLLFEDGGVGNQVYHEIEGCWDLDRLQCALRKVVSEHSALRLRIENDSRQSMSNESIDIKYHDLCMLSVEEQQCECKRLRNEKSHLNFSPQGAMIQVEVAIFSETKMILYVNHDGMIIDGISMFLLFYHWNLHYQKKLSTVNYLPFSEHIAAKESEKNSSSWKRSRDYWLQRIPMLPKAPSLPIHIQSDKKETRFTQRVIKVECQEWQHIQSIIRKHQLTPAAFLMAAYSEVLCIWGAGEHFTLNVTISDRRPIHPQAFLSIGPYSDLMLAEVYLDHRLTFVERAKQLQSRLHNDIDHRYFSGLDTIKEIARQRGPSFAKMPYTFNCTLGAVEGINGDALGLFGKEIYTISQTPQVLLDVFIFEQKGSLIIRLDGVEATYYPGFLTALSSGFQRLLNSFCNPETWTESSFNLLPEDQSRVRSQVNNTSDSQNELMLGDDFVTYARNHPDNIAIYTFEQQISYSELLNRVAYTVQWLKTQGVKQNNLVGLIAERSPEHVIGILAIILAGAAYLPIDNGLPTERRDFMLRDGKVKVVLTNVDGVTNQIQFDLRKRPDKIYDLPKREVPFSMEDLAYVLYTSGTTGDPKGVMVSHRNVQNVVADCHKRFSIQPNDRFFAISGFNFDLSVWDVFGALSAGAALVIPDADKATDVEHWAKLCELADVSIWNSVPAIVRMMFDLNKAMPSQIRLVMMSGDKIPTNLPKMIMDTQPKIDLWSLGGPTETTIWNICHPISEEDCTGESIPYGRPNTNNCHSIRNEQGVECPDWVPGEIYSSGVGVTSGYWADEERTADKYIIDIETQQRWFRTGDLGRYFPNGNIDIMGRVDLQIKVNGYRIEAGEIENLIIKFSEIEQVAVVAMKTEKGSQLVAHVVASTTPISNIEVRQRLRHSLPNYMIPMNLIWHPSLPLNQNKKIDRKVLSQLVMEELPSVGTTEGNISNNQTEEMLQNIWQDIFTKEPVDIEQDFLILGGDSLIAAQIVLSIRKKFGVSIDLESMYQYNSIRAMAAHIINQEDS